MSALLDWLFYQEWLMLLPLLLAVVPLFVFSSLKERQERAEQEEIRAFREVLDALSVSLRAGYSVENAIRETAEVLKRTLGAAHEMTKQWTKMANQLRLKVSADVLIEDFAKQSQSEEVRSFAGVFLAGRKLGGNLSEIVMQSADTISRKIEVEQEIQTSLAAKKLEQKVMAVMPLGIILYMQLTSPDYLSVLYHNLIGWIVMTICLVGWAVGLYWGGCIVKIEV